jgi:hypothetical protein
MASFVHLFSDNIKVQVVIGTLSNEPLISVRIEDTTINAVSVAIDFLFSQSGFDKFINAIKPYSTKNKEEQINGNEPSPTK